MNGYGIGLAAALAMCAGLVLLLTRRGPGLHRGLLLCGVSAVGGLLAARLVYWLGAADFFIGRVHSSGSFFWWTDGGFSLFGAVAGAVGAAWLAGRRMKLPARDLDALALPVMLFAAEERLLEWTACGLDFGMRLESLAWLTVPDEFGRVLNVALIEAILLAAMAGGLLWRMKHRREHSVRLRDALFMLGLVETLMISMRRDTYMMWGFVHQEQLYFYLLSAGIVMLAGFERRRLPASVAVSLLTAGAIIFLEFALDGRVRVPFAFMQAWADEFWYSLFILVLAGFAAWYFRLGRPEREEKTV